MADTHTYEFNVTMSCGGCSGAIDRVLKKLEGMSPLSSHHLSMCFPLSPAVAGAALKTHIKNDRNTPC